MMSADERAIRYTARTAVTVSVSLKAVLCAGLKLGIRGKPESSMA
jgi:hypothetical protein